MQCRFISWLEYYPFGRLIKYAEKEGERETERREKESYGTDLFLDSSVKIQCNATNLTIHLSPIRQFSIHSVPLISEPK